MLNQARARSTQVQWLRGPAEQLPFDDGALDAVVTTSAFHFFDQPAALREFHRVLSPGGLVAVSTLSARQPLLQGPTADQVETGPSPVACRDAAVVRGRRIRRRRSAPGPAAASDPGHLGPDHGRHQGLTKRAAGPSQWSRLTTSLSGRRRTGPCRPLGQPTTTCPASIHSSGTPTASRSSCSPP